MTSTSTYPDGITPSVLGRIQALISVEIASPAPTSALLDGSALERRNRRIAARALAGVTARFGVTLAQVVRESEATPQPVTTLTLPAPVFGKTKRTGRKARRAAARAAANLGRVA
ncbi:hypothetical protein [Umezawaea tangerina]|uniref:Uncharacterized protein n=1 Tax=Umezawaea tangerina TaxID=84725 RepID=A0A2T0SS86_9PSEU|nr:hypothetical protein [Umezawaea tangerina]PRY36281.1 hypothetical protein CLV43_112208 [Umezawaea tangerina]